MATAFRSTSQTPSRLTHCSFTRRRYHSLQQIRASSQYFIIAAYRKLFVEWIGCGSQSYSSSKAMTTTFFLSHSPLMEVKSSQGLLTGPFEFGMQPLALRCSHPFEAMMTGFILSRSRPMDPKSSQGLLTRRFEFGMQAPASRFSHPSEATMA